MAIYNKPDESVFASSARQGEVSNFPDIGRGWGISFDQTGGIPPMEWFNFLFKRTDEKFGYLFQRGLSEWSATQTYPEGALVQYKNLTYKAKRENTNKNPEQTNSLDWQRWGFTQSELKRATLNESGVTQLLTSINSNDETKSATPKSVKIAYDKGVEAKNAADDANTNANGRVSKSGDAINGMLFIDGVKSGGFANGLVIRNKTSGQNTSGFVDFYQSDTVPRASIWFRDAGKNSTQIEFLTTPDGSDFNRDSRQNAFTIGAQGALWSKQYGWLHNFFTKQTESYKWSDVGGQFYPQHYSGCQTIRLRASKTGGLLITLMNLRDILNATIMLPERYTGFAKIIVTDAGDARHSYGASMINQNSFAFYGRGQNTAANVVIIGWSEF
jgi:probable tail fiber protein (fragment)|nr:MAG TPA: Baseplate structural protein [Caudoviricetes sp.]